MRRAVPLIHVSDVETTVAWYASIGFDVINTGRENDDGEMIFAMLGFGDSRVMFDVGGVPSNAERREVDLYVYVDDVDGLHEQLKDRVEIVQGLYDAFYGMREFIIRDCNRFWITFGQEIQ
jgi:uncharacterized glyoxalase superfamily protein PhnB